MKKVLITLMSLDGVISKGENDNLLWGSKEDKIFYKNTTIKIGNVIIGENTYKTLPSSSFTNRTYYVLCKDSSLYEKLPNIEFFTGEIENLINDLENKGIKEVVIAGGKFVYQSLLEKGLVDEILVTVAPYIFGNGLKLFEGLTREINLELLETFKLNKNVFTLRYKVI